MNMASMEDLNVNNNDYHSWTPEQKKVFHEEVHKGFERALATSKDISKKMDEASRIRSIQNTETVQFRSLTKTFLAWLYKDVDRA